MTQKDNGRSGKVNLSDLIPVGGDLEEVNVK
jgi:hypothetical protein